MILILLGAVYRMWSYYGLGNISAPLLLDGLNCAGNENKLIDCPRPYPVGVVSCLYNEIAGIVCPSKFMICDLKATHYDMNICYKYKFLK